MDGSPASGFMTKRWWSEAAKQYTLVHQSFFRNQRIVAKQGPIGWVPCSILFDLIFWAVDALDIFVGHLHKSKLKFLYIKFTINYRYQICNMHGNKYSASENYFFLPKVGVSKNRGTPKWMVYSGKSY